MIRAERHAASVRNIGSNTIKPIVPFKIFAAFISPTERGSELTGRSEPKAHKNWQKESDSVGDLCLKRESFG